VLLGGELEHEIRREAVAVAADLLVEALGCDAVEDCELGIEQDALTALDEDRAGNVLCRRDDGACHDRPCL